MIDTGESPRLRLLDHRRNRPLKFQNRPATVRARVDGDALDQPPQHVQRPGADGRVLQAAREIRDLPAVKVRAVPGADG